jgi:hypothetical protein
MRGLGSVWYAPLNNDYLFVVPTALVKKAEIFFAQAKPVVYTGNSFGFFFCDKKFIVAHPEGKSAGK